MKKQLLLQTAKRAANWTIPPGFQSFIGQVLVSKRQRLTIPPVLEAKFLQNNKFRDLHKGQPCFILATGPSINKQDLRSLKDEICIACSMFFLHKDYREIDPRYHVFVPNHPPFGEEVPRMWFEGINKVCSEKTTLFMGHRPYEHSAWNFLERNPQYKKENIYYLNYCNSPALDESNYNNPDIWDLCKLLFSPRSVVYCAIQIAVYMGFKHIYLLGCNYDYLQNFAWGSSAHFYEDAEGFDDSAVWPSKEEFFLAYHMTWKHYRLMREYLETRGCNIYNATEGGLLDVFTRVTLSQALAGDYER